MDDDLRHFRPAYLKIQEEIERMNHALKPSYLSIFKQIERELEPIRRKHLEILRSIELSECVFSHLAEIVQANQRWQDLIHQTTASSRVFEDINRIHQTWLEKIKPVQETAAQLQARAKLFLADIAYSMTVTERLFTGIDFDAMQQVMALVDPAFLKFQDVIGNVTSTYGKLAASIRVLQDLTYLPAFALPGATREVFITGYALDMILVPKEPEVMEDASVVQLIAEVEQETSGCIELLQAIDPALVRPYIGAHDALCGKNVDRTRHILSSLRELWNHLLRLLAPDEHVLSWLSTDDKDLLHEGRPTRRTRVLYICRGLNYEPLSDFVVQDTHALVKLVEFLNRVHELDRELTDEQLRALLLRTDSWLMYILRIYKGTS